MKIIEYNKKYKNNFIQFNKDWIIDNFGFLEKEDIKTSEHIEENLKNGAKKLFLLSNSKLKPVLHIYEKFGFKEVKLDDYEYKRGDIVFQYIV